MITNSGGTIVFGGKVDRKKRFVENTVIFNPKLDSSLMREEIFGPIMPILPFKTIDDAIFQINQLDKALCIYYFGNPNSSNLKAVIDQTSSGGVSANEIILQSAAPSLGFGGVGASGYGRYIGEIGF
jgi:acyl-CoA reductase-like NAD-dependent aldehyde dehydrogenase